MGVYTFVMVTSVKINLYLVRSSSPCIPSTIINSKVTSLPFLVILFDTYKLEDSIPYSIYFDHSSGTCSFYLGYTTLVQEILALF